MSRNNQAVSRNNQPAPKVLDSDRARDELFHYIHRCGVLKATAEDQVEWMDDTIEYLAECFPSLSTEQLGELRAIGLRFCRPVIDNVQVETAPDAPGDEGSGEASAAAA